MATWLTHLRVADRLRRSLSLDAVEFLAGNLAPDSSRITREGFDPPTALTHCTKSDKSACEYAEFGKKYIETAADPRTRSFYTGYFCHLMTDVLWSVRICQPCERRFTEEFSQNPDAFYRRVKQDWHNADFLFLHEHSGFAPLRQLKDLNRLPNGLLNFFEDGMIESKIRFILKYYSRRRFLRDEYTYLSPAENDDFVRTAAEEIEHELLKSGYAQRKERT